MTFPRLILPIRLFLGFAVLALTFHGIPAAAQPQPTDTPAPASVAEAAGRMTVPPGFNVKLFAGEPDITQPIAFTWDHRGRMWVVECRTYPDWVQDEKQPGRDSIVILEDTNHDGAFDRRTVFADKVRNVSAIEVGFGGVWIGAIPYLQFIPDRDGDDKPDGPPENLLDGWNLKEVKHNIFSSFTWGPDGWLYATNGIQSKSAVGKPGTPADQRVKFDCGVWRYHPTKHLFEVVAVGTTNPWGLDFDEYGNCFITNCVIAHLWHIIPGAHYQRMYGQHFNPYHYGFMQSCADHLHWGGGNWTESRGGQGKHSEAGGGHAHVGAMVYLGDNWPDPYRGGLFTCNLHGNRVNHDHFEPRGSGVVARHGKDFLMANDPWFRGLAIKYGPDGAVYISDWTDTGECHNYKVADMSNGRIYRVAHGTPETKPVDLAKLDDAALIRLLNHKNQWWVRTARRLLQERATAQSIDTQTGAALLTAVRSAADGKSRLRALWALVAASGSSPELLTELLGDADPYVRGWAIRLAVEDRKPTGEQLVTFAQLAKSDPSPVVRLHLASALQRIEVAERWAIAEALVQHPEDDQDANLPLMVWFGIEPLVAADTPRALSLIEKTRLKIVQQYAARRAVEGVNRQGLDAVVALLDRTDDQELRKWLLVGLKEGLAGLRKVDMPAAWPEAYKKLAASSRGEVREGATQVGLTFGDAMALGDLRQQAADAKVDAQARQRAIQSLVTAKDGELAPLLHKLLDDRDVRSTVIKAIAAVGHPDSAQQIIKRYSKLSAFEKPDAVQTLVSRPAYASALLDAVESGVVARSDLNAYTVRQVANMNDKDLVAKLQKVWGDVRPTDKDKQQKIKDYKQFFAADQIEKADLTNGKVVYTKTCAACHTMFNEGGKVGPDLTGSQRTNMDYLLENIIDPSSQVAKEYRVTIIDTKDGRTIDGIVTAESDQSVTIQTTNELITLPKGEISKRRQSPLSMMPEGQLDALPQKDQLDLIGYLMQK